MKRLVLPLLCAAALTACVAPATYQPATGSSGSGFSEQRIENDRYRVTFRGAGSSPQIQDYALLRASDLTLGAGYDWFDVVNRYEDANAYSGSNVSVGTGVGSYGRHSSVGVGVGLGTYQLGSPTRTITLEIKMGKGAKPDAPHAYDARQVAEAVRGRMNGAPAPRP